MKLAVPVLFLSVLLVNTAFTLPEEYPPSEVIFKSWNSLESIEDKQKFVNQLISDLIETKNMTVSDRISQGLVEITRNALNHNENHAQWIIQRLLDSKKISPTMTWWVNSILFTVTQISANGTMTSLNGEDAAIAPPALVIDPPPTTTKYYEGINFELHELHFEKALASEQIFPIDPSPGETDKLIEELGHSQWRVREDAFEDLALRKPLDWKKIFRLKNTTTDPEIHYRLQVLIRERIPELTTSLEQGSIRQLPLSDLEFIFDFIVPYLLSRENLFHYEMAMKMLYELAERNEFVLHILTKLVLMWKETNLIDHLEPISLVLFNIARRHPDEAPFVEDIFREFFVSEKYKDIASLQSSSEDENAQKLVKKIIFLWLDIKLPLYLGQLFSATPHDLLERMLHLGKDTKEGEKYFTAMQLMAVARHNQELWSAVKKILYDETIADYMRGALLDYLYLIPDKAEINEILFHLASSPSFIIRQTALAKLTMMLQHEGEAECSCLALQDAILYAVENSARDVREKKEHLFLFKHTVLPPTLDILKPYLENEHFEIREVAYDILVSRDFRENSRVIFDFLCNRILNEEDPSFQNYILNKLLERNYYQGVPLKYFTLFRFLNTNPTEAVALRVSDFLESFPFPFKEEK